MNKKNIFFLADSVVNLIGLYEKLKNFYEISWVGGVVISSLPEDTLVRLCGLLTGGCHRRNCYMIES